jgi:glycosyltransferase involved in cell wall biosynthesis
MDRITEPEATKKARRVLIGTPCYDGKLEVWYVNGLIETIRQSMLRGIEIFPIWLSYDALIQRARNDLISLALGMECDDLIFIDSDIEWQPDWIFKLLEYPVDVVGGTYPKKGDAELYVVKLLDTNKQPNNLTGLIEVDGLGAGFLRFSRRAIQWLWDNSESYEEKEYNKIRKMIFEVVVRNNDLISEDIWVCEKLKSAGISTWLDPQMTCNHIGMKKYTGNFNQWLEKIRTSAPQIQPRSQPTLNWENPNYGNNSLNRFINKTSGLNGIKSLYK